MRESRGPTVVLGDLISRGEVRVKIVFSIERRARLDLGIQGNSCPKGQVYAVLVEFLQSRIIEIVSRMPEGATDRQRSGKCSIERRNMRIRRFTEAGSQGVCRGFGVVSTRPFGELNKRGLENSF
jgi:hypothetical protein